MPRRVVAGSSSVMWAVVRTSAEHGPSPATRTAAPLVDLTVNLPPEPSDTCDAAMRRSLADIGRSPALAALLAYAPVGGSVEHREAGVAWCASHGITASVDRLAVCGGAQQALTSVLSAHCEPGDVVLTEALTYPGFLAAARLLRLRIVGVGTRSRRALARRARARLPSASPEAAARDADAAESDDVGDVRRTPTSRRRHPARARRGARRRRTYAPLVPDAPRPLASLLPELSYYVSSFSKSVTPALRTAYVVAPTPALAVKLSPHLQATGWLAAPLMTEIASRWMTNGDATKIVAERRAESQARQTILHAQLGLPRSAGSPYALHHWLELPRPWDRASDFVEALRRRGVLVASGDAFAVDPTHHRVRCV